MSTNHIFRPKFIQPVKHQTKKSAVGDKANSLAKLHKLGFQIPRTFTCNWHAYSHFKKGDRKIIEILKEELSAIIDPGKKYAIRSSSNIEDSLQFSFAGQFESLLSVQSVDAIIEAIIHVWEETNSPQLFAYAKKHDIDLSEIRMGVIIQEMIEPELSGVTLTRNPVTYESEVIVEAIADYGNRLMQDGIDAMRWVVRNGDIAYGNQEGNAYRSLIYQLSNDALQIKQKLNMDADIEWVYDGKEIYYVQCRPISSLSKIKIYSNRISRDMLPGMIKPLVWSVNIPLVNSVWIDILESIVGTLDIEPEDLAHAFYYRTYFNMGIFGEIFKLLGMPPDALEKMMGLQQEEKEKNSMRPGKEIARHFPRIIRFTLRHLTISRMIDKELGKIESSLAILEPSTFPEKSKDSIFAEIEAQKIIVKKIAYYNIIAPLLMGFHNRMLKQHLERVGMDFLSFDLMEDIPENIEFDPNQFLMELHGEFIKLPKAVREKLLQNPEETLKKSEDINSFKLLFGDFMEKFGHFSDSGNDFSYSPWRENPELIMQMIANFEEKQKEEEKTSIEDIKTGFIRGLLFHRVYKNARKYRLLRNRVSSNYILGYGIFRYYFLALGEKLVEQNMLAANDDIFFLNEDQIRDAFASQLSREKIDEIISFHKEMMKSQENIIPPELIYGENEPVLNINASSKFVGVPASAGFYHGPACVVRSTDEFGKVEKGDVLVIPFSDVGWTPLFPKSGAVVSESGGMLSHCAIVAREYGIPSIVSALGVMTIKDGQMLTVDANAGIVYLK